MGNLNTFFKILAIISLFYSCCYGEREEIVSIDSFENSKNNIPYTDKTKRKFLSNKDTLEMTAIYFELKEIVPDNKGYCKPKMYIEQGFTFIFDKIIPEFTITTTSNKEGTFLDNTTEMYQNVIYNINVNGIMYDSIYNEKNIYGLEFYYTKKNGIISIINNKEVFNLM